MDTIAALNFGLVIAVTIRSLGVENKKSVMSYTVKAGIVAGSILSAVYLMLAYMGMKSSGVYEIQENGAWTLRCIVQQLFGNPGAILLAAIFTLACLTTCVGLITSISQFFSKLTSKLSYKQWVYLISGFSFLVCNQGLNTILGISVPVLDAIYPMSIVLIILGLCDSWIGSNRYIYPCTVGAVGCISILYVLDQAKVPLGAIGAACHKLPLYSMGLGWAAVGIAAVAVSFVLETVTKKYKSKCRRVGRVKNLLVLSTYTSFCDMIVIDYDRTERGNFLWKLRLKIENLSIGILAHVDAGKTTLSESLLYLNGCIRKPGRVDHGDAYLDTFELERERGITIFSKQAVLPLGDRTVTLLDTPGHVDFSAEMERTLQVMDYAILIINGSDGVQGHTATLWRLLKRYRIPVFLFVNKMDQEGTDKEALLKELKKRTS